MSYKFLFVFCFFIVINFVVAAQNVSPVFKNLTTKDGLPSSTIYFVMQDSKGYMWFTTDHGVARYNGYEFKVFTTRDGLEDNTVFNLFEDSRGRIWMFAFSGKLFYYQNEKIVAYKYNKVVSDFVNGQSPKEVYVDSMDNVYLTCHGRGEILITNSGKAIREFKFDNKEFNTLYVHEFPDTNLLSSIGGLNISSFQSICPIKIYFSNSTYVASITALQSKSLLWVGALRLNKNELIFSIDSRIFLYKNDSVFPIQKLPVTDIYFLRKDKQGSIYACTDKGLFVFNKITSSNESRVYFENKVVTGFCEDNEKGFWITTRDNGIFYSPDFAVKYLEVTDPKFARPTCLLSDLKNTVYAGYWNGAVSKIRGQLVSTIYSSPLSIHVYNLYLKNTNSLFVSGDYSGWIESKTFHSIKNIIVAPDLVASFKSNFVNRSDGFIYCAAQSNLYKINNDLVSERFLLNQRINCLSETNQKQLLLGCKNGAFLFIDSSKQIIPYIKSLQNISIEDIKQFHNQICFATQGKGLILSDGVNTVSITEANALVSDLINRIFIHGNDIWCATNKGINRIHFTDVSKFSYNISNITAKEGLPSDEINDIAFLNDTIWVATNSGICFFDSKHDFKNAIAPIIYITAMRINGVDTTIRNNYSLRYNQNNLKISFEGISYKSQTEITYRYVLKTANDSISGYTKNRDVDFLSLSAGDYSFSVYAKNSSGVWSKNDATLSFTIHPSWWNSWWFRLLIFLCMVMAVFIFYKIRVTRLKQKYDSERRQADLQLTALRSQMNPHFIFNVMNSIRTYMQRNDMPSAQKYLVKFSKLIRHTLESSGIQEISLSDELIALQNYAELEQQQFEMPFEFLIKMHETIDTDQIKIPGMLLQPIVENAIKHGIANLNYKGIITVEIIDNGKTKCRISDNGKGRLQSEIFKNDTDKKHQSKGVGMIADRIEAYNKAYNRNLIFCIQDLTDDSEQCIGTVVEIAF